MKHLVLMYSDPAHTRAMSESALDGVARKHETLREELTQSGELLNGAGIALPDHTTVMRLGPEGVVAQQGPLATETVEHLTAYPKRKSRRARADLSSLLIHASPAKPGGAAAVWRRVRAGVVVVELRAWRGPRP